MFTEHLFTESVWATAGASFVFAIIIIGMMILLERIIK